MTESATTTTERIEPTTETIVVRGARTNNLRGIDLDIPRDQLIVITGVSGSGKSSLAFDTLFSEGQRRYLESLSTYTRQFLNQLERPDVDRINGLPPTISVEQRAASARVRSTLATTTEIHDYLRLLYARAGTAHCPNCQQTVSQQTVQQVVNQVLQLGERRKVMVLAPLVRGRKGEHKAVFATIVQEGFVRARVNGEIVDIAEPPDLKKTKTHTIEAVIDRVVIKDGLEQRLRESVELAVRHGDGNCVITWQDGDEWKEQLFSTRFACANCSLSFPSLEPRSFSFNSPYGACEQCNGLGVVEVELESESAASPPTTRGKSRSKTKQDDDEVVSDEIIEQVCDACEGSRLAPFSRAVTVATVAIEHALAMTVDAACDWFHQLQSSEQTADDLPSEEFLSEEQTAVIQSAVPEIADRLTFLKRVGLGYLTLDRTTKTLSGGEFQRARLAGCLGSGLTGVCYILDEPTIGLHPRDTSRLITILNELRDQGNSVIVVEHDVDMIVAADYLIDIGPGAGQHGGELLFAGDPVIAQKSDSLTGRYLRGEFHGTAYDAESSETSEVSQSSGEQLTPLTISGATLHNLQDVSVSIPLGQLVAVTGVSGSGKSSLVMQTLVPAVKQAVVKFKVPDQISIKGVVKSVAGLSQLNRLVKVDQSPIGKSGRSNPATYCGVWDEIRKLYAKTRDAKVRGFTARRFSFNAKEGRCPECKGQGQKRIEMNFMPDMFVECPVCRGARFNRQTQAIKFRGKSVADVLRMRIDEATDFFENLESIHRVMRTLSDVGLGYLGLGQSSSTLSGGEAQRIKLAKELASGTTGRTLYILDEPTTGLHGSDIANLIDVLHRIVARGQSVIVIEHSLEVIMAANHIIDMGPDGGKNGGTVVATGTLDDIRKSDGPTGDALRAE